MLDKIKFIAWRVFLFSPFFVVVGMLSRDSVKDYRMIVALLASTALLVMGFYTVVEDIAPR